ncbi:4'-phosphopantetheinyl transferase family protein [Psychromicrobium sp. YIM B11713]|uniref:4'-phosphopantetheinyl transferase family protein n=1 Tax=Psychromicrobium sp. YIM B11713 TaxID=3145233 RepID=UPI00374EE3BD
MPGKQPRLSCAPSPADSQRLRCTVPLVVPSRLGAEPSGEVELIIDAVRLSIAAARTEWLSHAELARAEKFATEELRQRFISRRSALRRFVAENLDLAPEELLPDYYCPDHGRGPELDHGQPGFTLRGKRLEIALSSTGSGDWAVFALAASPIRLGIDVERVGAASFQGFDDGVLSPREKAELQGVPEQQRAAYRAQCWARKEALVKAQGIGLRMRPRDIDSTAPGLYDLPAEPLGLSATYACAIAVLPEVG